MEGSNGGQSRNGTCRYSKRSWTLHPQRTGLRKSFSACLGFLGRAQALQGAGVAFARWHAAGKIPKLRPRKFPGTQFVDGSARVGESAETETKEGELPFEEGLAGPSAHEHATGIVASGRCVEAPGTTLQPPGRQRLPRCHHTPGRLGAGPAELHGNHSWPDAFPSAGVDTRLVND